MKKIILLTLLLAFSASFGTYAQVSLGGAEGGIRENEMWFNLPKAPLEVSGKFFINEEFFIGDIDTYGPGILKDIPMRYDIFMDQMEIVVDGEKYGVKEEFIKEFSWYDTESFKNVRFLNAKQLQFEEVPLVGFLEMVYEDSISLGYLKDILIVQGSSSHSLIASMNEDRVAVTDSYFLIKGNDAYELSKAKKRNMHLFGKHSREIDSYIKKRNLSFRNREDLIAIIKKYSELSRSNI